MFSFQQTSICLTVASTSSLDASRSLGTYLILGAGMVHLLSIGILGRIPRFVGGGLIAAYAYFMYTGLIQ